MTHCGAGLLPGIWSKIGGSGARGVQLFFVISAYLAFVSFGKLKSYKFVDIARWERNRFFKLIPLYYLAIWVYSVVFGGCNWLGVEKYITGWNAFAHVTFVHGFFPHYCNSIIGVEWYIGVLAIFYILVPLLYKYINSLKKAIASFCVGSLLCFKISFMCCQFIQTHNILEVKKYIYIRFFSNLCIIPQFPVILLGIVLYHINLENNRLESEKDRKILSYTMLIFAIYMMKGMVMGLSRLDGLGTFALWGFWCFMVIISQLLYPCLVICNPIFKYIGRHSYPIYLFHFFIIRLYDKNVSRYVPKMQNLKYAVNWSIKIVVILICCVVLVAGINQITKWARAKLQIICELVIKSKKI